MPITIGSNINSLRTQRMLADSSRVFGVASERLASGQRINRASDDAAGLSVVSSLNARAKVLGRARLNVGDGQSLLDIADGTLSSVSAVLQRMSELAEQAANGSLGPQQRKALDAEYQQLSAEIRRMSKTTRMNGITPLARSAGTAQVTTYNPADTGTDSGALGVSGDGRYTLFNLGDVSTSTLYVRDNVTGANTQIPGSDIIKAGMSADGLVVYASANNVFTFDPLTGTNKKLTNVGSAQAYNGLTISANGSTIAFLSTSQFSAGDELSKATSAIGALRVYTADLRTGKITTAVTAPSAFVSQLQLSADGTQLAAAALTSSGIYRASIGASSLTSVLSGGFYSDQHQLAIANDGSVYFSTNSNVSGLNPSGSYQIYKADTGGNFSKLTNAASGIRLFNLSADQSTLLFLNSDDLAGDGKGSSTRLFSLDIGTKDLQQISQAGQLDAVDSSFKFFVSGDGNTLFSALAAVATIGSARFDFSKQSNLINFSVGDSTRGGITVAVGALLSQLSGLGGFTLTSERGARAALDSVHDNINNLSLLRSVIGAGQSRLEAAGAVLSSQELETKAAASRILDSDIAAESATAVRTQILQKAGAAVLAQANQQPSLALTLLLF